MVSTYFRAWNRLGYRWNFPLARALPFMVFAFCRAMAGYHSFGATLKPDFSLYTSGGIHVYPSPLGTALGSVVGPNGFVLLAALASSALILFVSYHSVGLLPVVAATLLPLGWITFFAGVDSIAAAIFLFSWVQRSTWKGRVGLALACTLHFALAPVLALLLIRRFARRLSLALVLSVGALAIPLVFAAGYLLLATPFGGLWAHLSYPLSILLYTAVTAVTAGAAWQAVAVLPWVRVHGTALLYDGAAAFSAGCLEAGFQLHAQARYCLPGFLLLCTALREGSRE
jgi:hypothetical protein